MKLAIVIPTYNEAETIPSLISELFEKIKQLVEKLDILIIDDSSPDGTADIVRELGTKYEKITVIQRPKKMGLGAAYKEGFRYVLEKLDSELVLQMDADHSHQPSEIPNMLEKIKNYKGKIFDSIRNKLNTQEEDRSKELVKYILELDRIRKTNYPETFKEWYTILNKK